MVRAREGAATGEGSPAPGDARLTLWTSLTYIPSHGNPAPRSPTPGRLLTQVHVPSPGVTLLVTLAAPQLHEVHMELVEDLPVQRVHCVHQLVGTKVISKVSVGTPPASTNQGTSSRQVRRRAASGR